MPSKCNSKQKSKKKICGGIKKPSLFQEARGHVRWKKVLESYLKNINLSDFKNKTFEQIFPIIYAECEEIQGLGKLAAYDIASSIARENGKNISKVYSIGNGPKKAIKKLDLIPKYQQVGKYKLPYVSIEDVIKAFDKKGYHLEEQYRTNTDGDSLESFLCVWQKNI